MGAQETKGSRLASSSRYQRWVAPASWAMSHLFTTMTSARPFSITSPARRASWSAPASCASRMQRHHVGVVDGAHGPDDRVASRPSGRWSACAGCPAVSVMTKRCPSCSSEASMLSRVVPATSETTKRSSRRMAFTSVLLPTLGRPTMASRISRRSSVGAASSSAVLAPRLRAPRLGLLRCGAGVPRGGQRLEDRVDQLADAAPVLGRDRRGSSPKPRS